MIQTRKPLHRRLANVPIFAGMAALAGLIGASTPEQAIAQSGFNNRDVCIQLERELARMQRPAPVLDEDIVLETQRAERAMHAAYRRAQQTGCFQRGFLIFQPQVPRACRRLEADYYRAKDTYEQLAARAGGGGRPRGSRRQRDRIISALAANRCGPQYEQYARARRGAGDVMSLFFGGGALIEPQAPGGGGYRTLCVRTCDGFYFPISFSTYPEFFGRDAAACQAACPASDAQLFTYPNPGSNPEDAETPQGVRLKDMPNAFRYRKELVPDCTCRSAQTTVANADGPASAIRASFGPQGAAEGQQAVPIAHIRELALAPVPPIKPGPYDIQDIENPSGPVEVDPADTTRTADNSEITSPATGNRPVRVIGPEFYVAQ
ncbi:MAG: DUF2865 domain-containing protein [Pseudomonadota bacterium]